MNTPKLSTREKEIVALACEGLTNEAIADRLGLSVGTVNTYWLRIKLKKGGVGRTDTVVNVFKEEAAIVLEQERVDWEGLSGILEKREISDVIAEKERSLQERTSVALMQLAMDHLQATTWVTDKDLTIHMITNGKVPSDRVGTNWKEGQTLYEIFKTADKAHPAVAAHLGALTGSESGQRLSGEFADMFLRVVPVEDEPGEILGCLSILSPVASKKLLDSE